MTAALFTLAGFVLLFVGGDLLVRGAANLALRLGISPMLVGLTVVGFGTSAPELLVSLQAALAGQPDIAVGNVVGSNIANVLLIVGASALLQPIQADPAQTRRDGLIGVVVSALLVGLAFNGVISTWAGAVLVALLVGYLWYSYRMDSANHPPSAELHAHEAEEAAQKNLSAGMALLALAGGLLAVLVGARLLIDGAVDLARLAGVSEAVIGLTVVAVGTSLPELATAVVAAYRNHTDVAIGNVLGSNVFNILAILGITALVVPVPINPEILDLDVWVMLGAATLLMVFLATGWRMGRPLGALLLLAYAAYVGVLYTG